MASRQAEAAAHNRTACAAFFRDGIASGEWTVWVARIGDEISSQQCVRLIRPVPRPSSPSDVFGYLTNVYTVPAYRGRGIGSELLRRVRAWAEQGTFNSFFGEFNFGQLKEADLMKSIRLFGTEVMPKLRSYEPF